MTHFFSFLSSDSFFFFFFYFFCSPDVNRMEKTLCARLYVTGRRGGGLAEEEATQNATVLSGWWFVQGV